MGGRLSWDVRVERLLFWDVSWKSLMRDLKFI